MNPLRSYRLLPAVFVQEELVMKYLHTLSCLAVFASTLAVVGCGKTDQNASIPKEKQALPATDLGNDPEYVKQFSGKKK